MKHAAVVLAVSLIFAFAPLSAEPQSFSGSLDNPMERVILTGTIITEGNTPPPESVTVTLDCGTREPIAQANTDAKGFFSIPVGLDDRTAPAYPSGRERQNLLSASDLSACELVARLPGFSAEPIRLSTIASAGMADVGKIVLHPTSQDRTFAVSVTSLAAPDKAKAAFAKGEEQKKKGKWAGAVEYFKKAIAAYPKYALAWLELGRVQASQNNFAEARMSFRESVSQDSRLSDGYFELARLAAQEENWHELANTTDRLLQVHPEASGIWFLNGAANFNLGNMRQAEVSVTRAMRADTAHRLPQTEYLYGLILARKENYQSAVEHIGIYLKLAPHAADAVKAQQALEEFKKRAERN